VTETEKGGGEKTYRSCQRGNRGWRERKREIDRERERKVEEKRHPVLSEGTGEREGEGERERERKVEETSRPAGVIYVRMISNRL